MEYKSITEKDSEKKIPGPSGSGESGTGPKPGEEKKKIVQSKRPAVPRLVERATALRGQSFGRPPEPKHVIRRGTTMDINAKDAEIPYVKFEAAVRDLVCSLMERQDRMNESIFNRINDIDYRLEDLEEDHSAPGRSR